MLSSDAEARYCNWRSASADVKKSKMSSFLAGQSCFESLFWTLSATFRGGLSQLHHDGPVLKKKTPALLDFFLYFTRRAFSPHAERSRGPLSTGMNSRFRKTKMWNFGAHILPPQPGQTADQAPVNAAGEPFANSASKTENVFRLIFFANVAPFQIQN